MKTISTFFFRKGNIVPVTLLASAFIGFITVLSFIVIPNEQNTLADMHLEPIHKTIILNEEFTVDVVVTATIPVNVFAGELFFDHTTLEVQSIDYHTSVADLWAEEPWYNNGEGTLKFEGGTTRKGGFIGTDKLITITFKATKQGVGTLFIKDAQILQHDGLGTEVALSKPSDAIFTIQTQDSSSTTSNLLRQSTTPSNYEVVTQKPSTDLNGDGKQTIADTSILLLNLGSQDMRYDLNLDGSVDFKDFNIILQAK